MSVVSINSKPRTGTTRLAGLAAVMAFALLLFATSCGSGSFAMQEDFADSHGFGADEPVTTSGGQLPAIPQDSGDVPSRGASAVETIPGSSAIMVNNGTVVDTTLVLTSSSASPGPGSTDELGWGLYRVSGLAGKRVTSLAVSAVPAELGQQYSVGVSNFSEGVWDFLQSTSLPEFEYDLSSEESRLVSRLGNLYFIVVVSGGDGATVIEASVISEDDPSGGEGLVPAMGGRPQASEGLSDRITVTWDPIDGADSYELWRAEDVEGLDEVFTMVASQTELVYTDMAIELSIEYHYKVRGVNSTGTGMFGSKDSGWAGTTPPEGEDEEFGEKEAFGEIEAITAESITVAGTVFAIDENTSWIGDDGLPTDPALFIAGTLVQIRGRTDGEGGWIATRVKLEDFNPGQQREVNGQIDSISETEIVVNGESFMLNESTEWLDDDNNPIQKSSFAAGNFVEVDSYTDGNGGWIAEKVKHDTPDGGNQNTQIGNIEAIDSETLTVNGVVFSHDGLTEWLDGDNNPLTPGDFNTGMFVKAEGIDDGNGGWLATKVKIEDEGTPQSRDETGEIQELTESSIMVNGVSFDLTGQTEWLDADNNPLTPADFSVGEIVDVDGTDNGSGGWTADKVKKQN